MVSQLVFVLLLPITLLICGYLYAKTQRRAPFPPGPSGWPIIGNLLDIPTERPWETFARWGDKYGPICSVTVLGQPMIIINDLKSAVQLLERKATITSERPRLVMGGDLVGYDQTMPLLPYERALKTARGHFSRLIGTKEALKRFMPAQEDELHRFLKRLLDNPTDIDHAIRHTAGAFILRFAYGIKAQDPVDPYVSLFDKMTDEYSELVSPGAFLVDLFPVLKFIPEWAGATFKRRAHNFKRTLIANLDQPYEFTRKQVNEGVAPPSFVGTILHDSGNLTAQDAYELKGTATSLCAGAADTTVGVILGFFLAMCLFPEVQKKAQEEIDRVIGSNRLPTLADQDDLPYVKAVAKEAFRYHAVGPTAVPHSVKEDTMINDFFIPAGSIIVPNVWKMAYDPEIYPNPEVFDPTRFMESLRKPAQQDPGNYVFGFGRRVCPGKLFAEHTVFLEVAMALATFTISKKVEDGVPIKIEHSWIPGALSSPGPFEYELVPRSETARALIVQYHDSQI